MKRPTYDRRVGIVARMFVGDPHPMPRIIAAIWEALDGEEWGPDTLDSIAETIRSHGMEIKEPDEYDAVV